MTARWLLYVKQSAGVGILAQLLNPRARPCTVTIQTIEITKLTQPRHKDDNVSARAVRTSIGHLRSIVIVASSFGRLGPEIHLRVKWRMNSAKQQLLSAAWLLLHLYVILRQ
jgi:hypothetical protein